MSIRPRLIVPADETFWSDESEANLVVPVPNNIAPVVCPSNKCIQHKEDDMGDEELKKSKKRRSKKEDTETESSSESEDTGSSATESSESSSSSSDSDTSSSSSSSSSSESESPKEKKTKSKSKKVTKKRKSRKDKPDSDKKKSKKAVKVAKVEVDAAVPPEPTTNEPAAEGAGSDEFSNLVKELEALKVSSKKSNVLLEFLKLASKKVDSEEDEDDVKSTKSKKSERSSKSKKSKKDKKEKKDKDKDKDKSSDEKRSSKTKYKRVDEIWDDSLYDYRLRETSDKKKMDEWNKYVFTVRRKFNCENHYQNTVVDIKSKHLRDCLKIVMDGVQGVSLVEKTPILPPDMLFLYLEDFRDYRDMLSAQRKHCLEKKEKKEIKTRINHLELLIAYLDKDYDELKKTLYPMLENGTVTFDLLWALYKPNTLAYAATNGDENQPRTFRMEYITKERHFMRGMYYEIEGKYMDFDGENFGQAYISATVPQFQGSRKISSLPCYPLRFHQNADGIRAKLLERGKKFLTLAGTNYKYCKGICYVQKDGKILKANINGRVMIDPQTFRRINPNYPLAEVEVRDIPDDSADCQCKKAEKREKASHFPTRLFMINKKEDKEVEVLEMSSADDQAPENLSDPVKRAELAKLTFTEEELLMLNPLIAGFSFSEKIWVELAVSTISDVQWNDGAFDSLVIPEKHKSIVKALVSSHGQHSSKSIDDVITGKGKGLVAVLHGKPGLGKTLTCEAVSDLLKRPLYTVSAGDLGTSATHLEIQLQTILDVAHTWGAVLLLDEADVFLEKRSTHDVHRNALVSIFLRLLEYFQGILILTTNRVETFDEAFVSRIHLSLRYSDLTVQARKSIWKNFITKVAQAAAANASASSVAGSETDTNSTVVPTPGTTLSTPNSGSATPIATTPAASVVLVPSTNGDNEQASTATNGNAEPSGSTGATDSSAAAGASVGKITEANYAELSRVELNGRQIKNLVKTAQALALYEGVPMGMGHLRRCIEVGRDFELDLKGGRGWEDAMRSYT